MLCMRNRIVECSGLCVCVQLTTIESKYRCLYYMHLYFVFTWLLVASPVLNVTHSVLDTCRQSYSIVGVCLVDLLLGCPL